jgi:hypothetical protein
MAERLSPAERKKRGNRVRSQRYRDKKKSQREAARLSDPDARDKVPKRNRLPGAVETQTNAQRSKEKPEKKKGAELRCNERTRGMIQAIEWTAISKLTPKRQIPIRTLQSLPPSGSSNHHHLWKETLSKVIYFRLRRRRSRIQVYTSSLRTNSLGGTQRYPTVSSRQVVHGIDNRVFGHKHRPLCLLV